MPSVRNNAGGSYDPSEYARKKQAQLARANKIRHQRERGEHELTKDCTFQPNPRYHEDEDDELNQLSRKHVDVKSRQQQQPEEAYTYSNNAYDDSTEHLDDQLSQEVKRQSKSKPAMTSCLRNSSCTCPQCVMPTDEPALRERPSSRRQSRESSRENSRAFQAQVPRSSSASSSASSGLGQLEVVPRDELVSLSLLKSKMKSKRKSRSAPGTTSGREYSQSGREYSHYSTPSASEAGGALEKEPAPREARRQRQPRAQKQLPPPLQQVDQNQRQQRDSTPTNPEEYQEIQIELHPCPDCGRKFNDTAFVKHRSVCQKVFQTKRKQFNMSAARIKGTDTEHFLKENSGNAKAKGSRNARLAEDQPINVKKQPSWKQQSNALRDAMKANKDLAEAKKSGKPLPPPVASAPDPSFIQCSSCSRRFNEKAAERHIPKCKEMMERNAHRLNNRKTVPNKSTAGKTTKPTAGRRPRR